jgi:hypothetical protein
MTVCAVARAARALKCATRPAGTRPCNDLEFPEHVWQAVCAGKQEAMPRTEAIEKGGALAVHLISTEVSRSS